VSEIILIFALLTTESSYKADVERPMAAVGDTIQFSFGAQGTWRVRTFAMDHDIHVYSIGTQNDNHSFSASEAEEHINKHYGDVLRKIYVIRFKSPASDAENARVLQENGLSGKLEVTPAGFAFYNPDRVKYKTQSTPK